jgi:hypothetical protein
MVATSRGDLGSTNRRIRMPLALGEIRAGEPPLRNTLATIRQTILSLITPEIFDLRQQALQSLGATQRILAALTLPSERSQTEIDDSRWFQWYDHYHALLLGPDLRDFHWHIGWGLGFNLETTGLYVLN